MGIESDLVTIKLVQPITYVAGKNAKGFPNPKLPIIFEGDIIKITHDLELVVDDEIFNKIKPDGIIEVSLWLHFDVIETGKDNDSATSF